MKKFLALFLIIAASMPFIWKQYAYAQEKETEITVLAENESVDRDYFASNETVIIAGTINGDAYIFGGKVSITEDGIINGDLIVAGGEVNIRGNVRNDLRVAGGEIMVNANIGGNVSAAGGNVEFGNNGQIQRSFNAAGGTVSLKSTVGRDANIAAGQIMVDSEIKRDLRFWSEQNADISDKAIINGETYPHVAPQGTKEGAKTAIATAFTGLSLLFKLTSLITTLVIGYLLLKFVPQFTKSTLEQVAKNPLQNFLTGFMVIILLPILALFLFITVIGIPLALVILSTVFILLLVAKAIASIFIGNKIFSYLNQKQDGFVVVLAGAVVYLLATSIPLVGGLIGFVLACISIGSLLIQKKVYYKNLRAKKLI